MSKIEILAPVGSEEMLHAAVFSGADAVYLGFSGFNARTSAGNFDADSLKEAVRFCHVRGVKVHVALNTTVYGGELPALVLVDSVVRVLDGVLSQPDCYEDESHFNGLLEYPQYTRPEVWEGEAVPPVLLSGHHANIMKWRHEQSLLNTAKKRPEMLDKYPLTKDDLDILHKEFA